METAWIRTELQVNKEFYFVLIDLQAQKNTLEILNRLNRCYPVAENEMEKNVQQLLGPINKLNIHQATDALQQGDAERLGQLMVEAQDNFDRYATPICPEELTAPVLHNVLNYPAIKSSYLGRQRGWLTR